MTLSTAIIDVPLEPALLRQAGVPLEDALWLARHRSFRARQRALRHHRGENIVHLVQRFIRTATNVPSVKLVQMV